MKMGINITKRYFRKSLVKVNDNIVSEIKPVNTKIAEIARLSV
jgi:hypothetical protein